MDSSSIAVDEYLSQLQAPTSTDNMQCLTEADPSDCVQSMQSLKLSSEGEGEASLEVEQDTIDGDGWTVVSKEKQKQR